MADENLKIVDPESDALVSEQLAERNQELGKEAVNLAERDKELSASNILYKATPFYWSDRKWWKKDAVENTSSRERLDQEVQEYIEEIQEEAENYVLGYEEYEGVLMELSQLARQEAPKQKMDTFIEEMDGARRSFFRYEANKADKGEPAERSELFKKQARLLALKDFFTPSLPLDPELAARGYTISTLSLDGENKYRTSWPRERILRRDVGLEDKRNAVEAARQAGNPAVLELTIDSNWDRVLDGKKSERRYLPLSQRAKEVVDEFPGAIDGKTDFYGSDKVLAISRMPYPDFTIRFRGVASDTDNFENKMNEPQTSAVLEYEVEGPAGVEHKRLELRGSDEDVRQQALETVIGEEMGPNAGMNLVHGATITLPDGAKKSWHEFTQPASEEAA